MTQLGYRATLQLATRNKELETICREIAEYVRLKRQTHDHYGWKPEWAEKLEAAGFNVTGKTPER